MLFPDEFNILKCQQNGETKITLESFWFLANKYNFHLKNMLKWIKGGSTS